MSEFALYILTALALVFVIEGLLYALFPGKVRQMMVYALTVEPEKFRAFGFIMVAIGVALVWILQGA